MNEKSEEVVKQAINHPLCSGEFEGKQLSEIVKSNPEFSPELKKMVRTIYTNNEPKVDGDLQLAMVLSPGKKLLTLDKLLETRIIDAQEIDIIGAIAAKDVHQIEEHTLYEGLGAKAVPANMLKYVCAKR